MSYRPEGSSALPVVQPDEGVGGVDAVDVRGQRAGGASILDRTINLSELLDLDAFKDICASFVDLYKIGIKIFDADGTKLVDIRVGNGDWCGYIFQNPVGRQKCTALVGQVKSFDYPGLRDGKVVEQACFSGLKYVIMPITYGGDYLGRVIYGPFRPGDLTQPGAAVHEFPDFDPKKLWSYGEKIRRAPDETIIKILNNFRKVIDTVTFIAMKALMTQQLHVESITASYNELSESNRKLRASYEKLQEVDRMKSNFLAMISHELRTPLTSVIGYSEMLIEGLAGDMNADQTSYVSTIKEKGEHLLGLISSLLDLTKIEAGQLQLDVREVDPSTLAERATSSVFPQAQKKGVELQTELEDGLASFRADPEKLGQCLVNLLGNAVKFTPEGGRVTLRMGAWTGNLPGDAQGRFGAPERAFVRFEVEDTGIGIPQDKLEAIFRSFYQVDNSITREYGGTGLGLAIVKRLVEAHLGDVQVDSGPERGTRFTVLVPVEAPEGGAVRFGG
jgi:signal transduction histidine kinase